MSDGTIIALMLTSFFSGVTVAMLYARWDLQKLRNEIMRNETRMIFRQYNVPDGWTNVARPPHQDTKDGG